MSKSGSNHFAIDSQDQKNSKQKANEVEQPSREQIRFMNDSDNKRIDRATKVGASGRRHFDARDRRKSVSKSI